MLNKLRLSFEEEIIVNYVQNAVEKIVASVLLYNSKLAYTSSYFLCVIAEEELSKLFFLPIAIEVGKLNELSQSIQLFRNHRKKQKTASSLSYFEKDWSDIEIKKQKCLYISIKNNKVEMCRIKPEDVYRELNHVTLYFQYQMRHISLEKRFSKDLLKILLFQTQILGGCIKEKLPELLETSKKQIEHELREMEKNNKKRESKMNESAIKNPYELIRLFQALFGQSYRKNLEEILGFSKYEIIDYLYKMTVQQPG